MLHRSHKMCSLTGSLSVRQKIIIVGKYHLIKETFCEKSKLISSLERAGDHVALGDHDGKKPLCRQSCHRQLHRHWALEPIGVLL